LTKKASSRASLGPKLTDVAQKAGVSPMTVSRVINRESNVREETRAKVEAAIADLKYIPNTAARKLAGATQLRLALVFGNPSRAWLSEVLVGCLSAATRGDVRLLLEQCHDEAAAVAFARRASAGRLDGVILPPPFCDSQAVVTPLLAAGIPVAVIASGAPLAGTIGVAIDERAAGYDMTRHLLDLGHRRIGFIAGDPRQTGSTRRLEGYRQALDGAGLTCEPDLIVSGEYTYSSGLAAADVLLGLALPPTAIFASNDDMAAAAIAAAHRRHMDVPQDISVAGFDDTALATTISPELTTVRQPIAEMAGEAVAMLVEAARTRRSGTAAGFGLKIFQHEIIARQSASAPRHADGA
jgi:LacI family transcriptional regulator